VKESSDGETLIAVGILLIVHRSGSQSLSRKVWPFYGTALPFYIISLQLTFERVKWWWDSDSSRYII